MNWLVDTSVLIGSVQKASIRRESAEEAVKALRSRKGNLYIVPQNLIEFWAVATRPIEANGLGLSIEDAQKEIDRIKILFVLKSEDETIFDNWEKLVSEYRVIGKTTHDARLVAAMQTHGIENLLTFNVADFKRYSGLISVSTPHDFADN